MHTYTAGIKEDFKQRVRANAGSSVSVKVTSPVAARHGQKELTDLTEHQTSPVKN